jgi:transcriptional regulator with XRE-family HTH domain
MTKATTSRALRDWIALFPGTRDELAARLGVTRMVVWKLENCQHARAPYDLLRSLSRALRRPADGSAAPTFEDLVKAWNAGGTR